MNVAIDMSRGVQVRHWKACAITNQTILFATVGGPPAIRVLVTRSLLNKIQICLTHQCFLLTRMRARCMRKCETWCRQSYERVMCTMTPCTQAARCRPFRLGSSEGNVAHQDGFWGFYRLQKGGKFVYCSRPNSPLTVTPHQQGGL